MVWNVVQDLHSSAFRGSCRPVEDCLGDTSGAGPSSCTIAILWLYCHYIFLIHLIHRISSLHQCRLTLHLSPIPIKDQSLSFDYSLYNYLLYSHRPHDGDCIQCCRGMVAKIGALQLFTALPLAVYGIENTRHKPHALPKLLQFDLNFFLYCSWYLHISHHNYVF